MLPICNYIQQGSESNHRDGRGIKLLDVTWNYIWQRPAASTNTTGSLRSIVFVWHPPTSGAGNVPSILDVLVSAASYSAYNLNTAPNYTILFDQAYNAPPAGLATQEVDRLIQGKARINMEQYYPNASSGLGVDTQTNAVYMIVLQSFPAATPAIGYGQFATRFIDI